MRFPVDTRALRFTVAGAPEPLQRRQHEQDSEAGSPRPGDDADAWRVPLRLLGAGPEQLLRVEVAGDPRLAAGAPVSVEGLTLLTWKRPRGGGWSLRARAIHAQTASRQVSPAGA